MNFLSKNIISTIFALNFITTISFAAAQDFSDGDLDSNKESLQTNGNTVAWKRFSSEKSGFSIDLPQNPEHIHQMIKIPKTDLSIQYDTFISEPSDKIVYVISVWDYPQEIDMSTPEVNLQDGFGGMLSALPDSKVLQMDMNEVQGFKALEFLVKNEDIYFQGKLVLVHNTLYQIFSVYKDGEELAKEYKHFIDSFRLLNPESRKAALKKDVKPLNV